MAQDIAVFMGKDGVTANIYEKGKIIVYRKKKDRWAELRDKEFLLDKSLGLPGLRGKAEEAVEFLADCKVFVALSIGGVFPFVLEKAGFSVWEFEGRPAEFLDYILEQEEQAQAGEAAQQAVSLLPLPVETGNGSYKISLREIQAKNFEFSSKQVLLPFLRRGEFYSLEILCNHVPPWLEAELISGNLRGEITKISEDELMVTIIKKAGEERAYTG